MKIQSSVLNSPVQRRIDAPNSHVFEKNQLITGKIISIQGNEIQLLFSNSHEITAHIDSNINLPVDVNMNFQVLNIDNDVMFLKAVDQNPQTTVSKERLLNGLAYDLGIPPTASNIDFLNKCEDILGKGLIKIVSALQSEGNINIVEKLQNLFIGPEKLVEYIKSFGKEGLEKLITELCNLTGEIQKEGISSKPFSNVLADIVKGLYIQTNHPFPLFYIPIPLMFENTLYPGELWIEKNAENSGEDHKDFLSIFLSLTTPNMDRIEAHIKNSGPDLCIEFYCKKECISLFDRNLSNIKNSINSLGVNIKYASVSELKYHSNFFNLSKKYLKTYPSVDIKI